MTTWYDRVTRRVAVLEAQEKDDKETFLALFEELDDHRSRRDGERVVRNDEGGATSSYKGDPVFSFSVREGEIKIETPNGETTILTERQSALNKMADLMARAVRGMPAGSSESYLANQGLVVLP